MTDTPNAFLFPKHDCSLTLTHNQHLDYYLTVEKAILEKDHGYDDHCWVSEEQKQKAIKNNNCWTLQWYPHTPIGFCILSACDLNTLIEHAMAAEY